MLMLMLMHTEAVRSPLSAVGQGRKEWQIWFSMRTAEEQISNAERFIAANREKK
jgi:hypothetical protein